MKKFRLITIVLISIILLNSQDVNGSAVNPLSPSSCSVIAEVVGRHGENRRLYIKILDVFGDYYCPAQINGVYRAIDNHYLHGIKEGDIIKAGISTGSSMSPNGAFSYLQWRNVKYEDDTAVDNIGRVEAFLQTSFEPIFIDNFNDALERNKFIKHDNQDTITKYYYLVIPLSLLTGLFLLLIWRKLSKRHEVKISG